MSSAELRKTGESSPGMSHSGQGASERNGRIRRIRRLSFLRKTEALRRFASGAWFKKAGVYLRPLNEKDQKEIRLVLEDAKAFTVKEIDVAISLVDEALHGSRDYRFLVAAEKNDSVIGYICYGQTPMTSDTWDVYWIAVSRPYQRRHIGSLLLGMAEREIQAEKGRLILIETSSKPRYRSTRRFYHKMGYHLAAKIEKFYAEDDDKLIFCKYPVS